MMKMLFLKSGDCVEEYEELKGISNHRATSDGFRTYLEQILEIIDNNEAKIISIHYRKWRLKNDNVDLAVFRKTSSTNLIIKVLSYLKINLKILMECMKYQPDKIISIDNGRYIIPLSISAKLLKSKIVSAIPAEITGRLFASVFMFLLRKDRRISLILVLSESMKKDLIRGGVEPAKIKRYKPYYDNTFMIPRKIDEYSFKDEKEFRVFFVGRFSFIKGIWTLMEIIKRLKDERDIRFYLIGNGSEIKKFTKILEEENLDKKAKLLGYVENKYLYSYLKKADVILIPSRNEGLGKVALEAILSQVPIVASNVGGLRDIITDNKTGFLVDRNDIDLFVEKILLLKNNPGLKNSLKQNLINEQGKILGAQETLANLIKEVL